MTTSTALPLAASVTVPDKLVVVVFDPQVVSGLDPYQDLYRPQLRSRLVRVEALLQKLEY